MMAFSYMEFWSSKVVCGSLHGIVKSSHICPFFEILGFTKDNRIEFISVRVKISCWLIWIEILLLMHIAILHLTWPFYFVYVMLERILNYQQPKQKSIKNLFA